MSQKVGDIVFDLSIDVSGLKSKIRETSNEISDKFKKAFNSAEKNAKGSSDKISKSVSDSQKRINAILNDGERSMKSKAASIAAIYRQMGDSQKDAMKKAWNQIDRNSGKFKDRMNESNKGIIDLNSGLKKMAFLAGGAFAAKKIFDFGKQAIQLGSDLTEVQNVVDVTFPKMTKQVDDFAKNAAQQFGLSETMAKRYTGTFGAMAKAFGFGEKQAYDMSTALTGLSGDVASFYNISQDEAYTKLKSVFTGETETLKDLGIVMTQNALDAYAMANGYNKTTKEMSEAEKVALRFAFVQQQLSLAAGDFSRTSGSWANQVRLMKLQMEQFMATIGQGLINLFTPILRLVNMLLAKILTLANAFKSLTELLTGNKSTQGSGIGAASQEASALSGGLADAGKEASGLGKATDGVGKSAKKAAKEMKALMGFDQINKLDDQSDSGSDGGSGGNGGGPGDGAIHGASADLGKLAEGESKLSKLADGLLNRFKELLNLFKTGFNTTFKFEGINRLKKAIMEIGQLFYEIFTDKRIVDAFNGMLDKFAYALGQYIGALGNIALSIGIFIAESIANGIKQQKEHIITALAEAFTNVGLVFQAVGNIAKGVSEIIYDTLTSEGAIKIGAAIVSMFTSEAMTIIEIGSKIARDFWQGVEGVLSTVKLPLTTAFTGTLDALAPVFETVAQCVDDLGTKLNRIYDESIGPFVSQVFEGIGKVAKILIESYNQYVLPVLEWIGTKFSDLYDQHIKPFMDEFGVLIESVIGYLSAWWDKMVQVFSWIANNILPILMPIVQWIAGVLFTTIVQIIDIIKNVMTILSGLIDFLTGIFTGNWSLAWEGIHKIVDGAWQMIKDTISNALKAIQELVRPIKDFFGAVFKAAWELVALAWSNSVNYFSNVYNSVKGVFANVGSWFRNKFQEAYNAVVSVFSGISNFFGGIWNSIRNTFSYVGTMVGNAIGGAVRSVINGVLSTVENTINSGISLLNSAVDVINMIPGVSLGGFDYVDLPRLAQGGYVKANTPQLAMIGDNKRYGEIVAPENKMLEMARKAAELTNKGGNNDAQIIAILTAILQALQGLDLNIDGERLTNKVVDTINEITIRRGESPILQ